MIPLLNVPLTFAKLDWAALSALEQAWHVYFVAAIAQ